MDRWKALAVSCIDGRFLQPGLRWLTTKLGPVFDYRTELGCSKAIVDSLADRQRLFNVVETARELHSIEQVWLVDHVDCGAYGGSRQHQSPAAERAFHLERLAAAQRIVERRFPELEVHKVYLGWEGAEEVP